tara:strand:- start:88 stop:477 length:390 start_codon:yes stop_codon:yes gene_type:complete
MKKLLILFTALFPVIFSSPSYSKWTEVTKSASGITYYIDFERIRKQDEYVYFWTLSDRLKPNSRGTLSAKVYRQGDCNIFRFKYLSDSYYNEQMGQGTSFQSSNEPEEEWTYPPPESSAESILESACSQ